MEMMKSVRTGKPGEIDVVSIQRPSAGPKDVVLRIRACGICGTDTMFIGFGGAPTSPHGPVPLHLGHEPAGEIVEVGADVVGLDVGDRVVINPMAIPSGMLGTGGPVGAMTEYVLIEDAEPGKGVNVIPAGIPFEVAALNEPMAVAKHAVNRSGAEVTDKVVIFGAGPIGLGAAIWLKLRGVKDVVVVDVVADRLKKALAIGADAVIDSSHEDVTSRLIELHGHAANALGAVRAGTDIYIDAAGAPSVIDVTQASAKWGAKLVIAAVHKKPVDISGILRSELTIIGSMGYPTEIFEVTQDLAEHWRRFALLISHTVPFAEVEHAYELALTPGAAEKVVVTFD
jgi:(R,R)-butanediol dehydrogenase/meso-butanediol dehydrogenase/diacetyl reductase